MFSSYHDRDTPALLSSACFSPLRLLNSVLFSHDDGVSRGAWVGKALGVAFSGAAVLTKVGGKTKLLLLNEELTGNIG